MKENRIYLIGFMGSGKSSLGKELAGDLKMNFLDLDDIIEEETGEEINQIFQRGEAEFRKIEAELLRSLKFSNTVFALGGGTPCFHNNMDFIKNSGVSVYLKVSKAELFERLKHHRKIRPLLSGMDSDNELKDYIKELLNSRTPFYEQADIVFNAGKDTAADLIRMIDQFK